MNALYITYDGLTDNLGQSQILPYLRGLAAKGHRIHVLSCEKKQNFAPRQAGVRAQLAASGIGWSPIAYTKRPPIFSTLWDLWRLRREATRLVRQSPMDLVHCRSYIAALVGLHLKRRYGLAFLFDMRGFWADERVEGGLWNPNRIHYRLMYKYFKWMEQQFFKESFYTVSLTNSGKQIIHGWNLKPSTDMPIEVIPCCADFDHFSRDKVSPEAISKVRDQLNLSSSDFVITYLGSLGTWYRMDEMLRFYSRLLVRVPNAKFLIVTPDDSSVVEATANRVGLDDVSGLRILAATRDELPALLSVSNVGLLFIEPVFSKQGSSATKFGELLSMGIPLISNAGVGDHDSFLTKYRVGVSVNEFSIPEYERVLDDLTDLGKLTPDEVREAGLQEYSLDRAIDSYNKVYQAARPTRKLETVHGTA